MSEMNWLVHLNRGYPTPYITIFLHSIFLTLFALCGYCHHQKHLSGGAVIYMDENICTALRSLHWR